MTYFIIGIGILIVLYFVLWYPSAGKFWHKHQWYPETTIETPSMYSKKKMNYSTIWKCNRDNCWAFDVVTITREKNERV